MKYRCLILDHDDTAVDSTATVHYPAHLEVMRRMRPGEEQISLDQWFRKNFDPGIIAFLTEELLFTEEEMAEEFRIWQDFNTDRNPPFFPGFPELMKDFVDEGGMITVVSHSSEEHIRRHYSAGAPGIEPAFVFGWENDEEKRKPSPWPVQQILAGTGCSPDEVLVVDDLKPGVEMARAAGVPVAGAGWGHDIPEIRKSMESLCDVYLKEPEELRKLLFG